MTPQEIKHKQMAVGKFLFYARAIDNTMLHALNDIATSQDTTITLKAVTYFLDYAASNPRASIIYRASDMQLQIESDAAYLVCPHARSRAGGYHYLSNTAGTTFNGPITVIVKVIKHVMSSAAEAEVGALFMNAQEAIPLRKCLEDLGHPQKPTPINTDNATAQGIVNDTMKQKRSKAMDMRFYWVRDRVQQKQFNIRWQPGKSNLAEYPTKHHTGNHHQQVRPIYLYDPVSSPRTVQGCIKILGGEHKAMRAQCARTKKQVTWAPSMPKWKGHMDRQRCTPKGTPSTKSIHSLRVNYTSTRLLRSTRMLKTAPKGMRRLFSFY